MKLLQRKAAEPPPPAQGATRLQPETAPRKRSGNLRLGVAAGLTIGLFAALVLWLEGQRDAPAPAAQPGPAAEQKASAPQKPPPPRFDFYQQLTQGGSELSPETAAATAAPAQPAAKPQTASPAASASRPAPSTAPVPAPSPAPAAVKPAVATAAAPVASVPAAAAVPAAKAAAESAELSQVLQALQPAQPRILLQAGSWSTPERAAAVRDQLAASGLNAAVTTAVVGSKTWYRVQVGPYSDRSQIDAVSQQLRAAGFTPLSLRADR